jgi:dephospho-CoA kinase
MSNTYKLPKIIGLLARSRSGKDTVADYIILKYGASGASSAYNIVKRRLAGPIKNAVKELYGFTDDHLETDIKDIKIERFNCSPRDAMVQITKAIMELSGTDFFTNKLYNSIAESDISEITIIPDIRYIHDIERIHNNGGIVIKIERNLEQNVHYINENNIENMMADFVITNNGTLEELYEKINNIIAKFSIKIN